MERGRRRQSRGTCPGDKQGFSGTSTKDRCTACLPCVDLHPPRLFRGEEKEAQRWNSLFTVSEGRQPNYCRFTMQPLRTHPESSGERGLGTRARECA